jgi:hypothetical protein
MKEYTSLCRWANQLNDQNQTTVNYENFKNGNTIFAFNLSPDLSDSFQREGHVSPPREGIVRFEIQFSQATDEVLNSMFYCEFDNMLSITEDRQSQTDY